jgi:hypothetical protein
MLPALLVTVSVTDTADIRRHLVEAIGSGFDLSLTLPALTFALGGLPLECDAPIELSLRSFADGAVLDAQELSNHFVLSNGCHLIIERLTLINGASEQVLLLRCLTHPAGSDPVFHDSVNLSTDTVKIRSKFTGTPQKFPRKEQSDEFRRHNGRGGQGTRLGILYGGARRAKE